MDDTQLWTDRITTNHLDGRTQFDSETVGKAVLKNRNDVINMQCKTVCWKMHGHWPQHAEGADKTTASRAEEGCRANGIEECSLQLFEAQFSTKNQTDLNAQKGENFLMRSSQNSTLLFLSHSVRKKKSQKEQEVSARGRSTTGTSHMP